MRILTTPDLKERRSDWFYKRKMGGLPNNRPKTNKNNVEIFINGKKWVK
jgi:hypothetical protein